MSQVQVFNSGGGSGPTDGVQTLTGDTNVDLSPATPVPATGGNIDILGYPATGNVPVVQVLDDAPNSTQFIEDRTFLTQFVVDPSVSPGQRGTFSTVQAAINAAEALASSQVMQLILRNGVFPEDLAINGNLKLSITGVTNAQGGNISASSGVSVINGNITVTGFGGFIFMDGVVLDFTTGGAKTFTNSAPTLMTDCRIIGGNINNGGTLTWNNVSTNSNIVNTGSGVLIRNCRFLSGSSFTNNNSLANVGFFNCMQMPTVINNTNSAANGFRCYNCGFGGANFNNNSGEIINFVNCYGLDTGNIFNGTGVYNFGNSTPPPSLTANIQIIDTLWGNVIIAKRVAGDIALTNGDFYGGVTDTSVPRSVTLPDLTITPSVSVNQCFMAKDESGGAASNNITITAGASLIDGAASKVINTNYGSFSFTNDGTNYFTM